MAKFLVGKIQAPVSVRLRKMILGGFGGLEGPGWWLAGFCGGEGARAVWVGGSWGVCIADALVFY